MTDPGSKHILLSIIVLALIGAGFYVVSTREIPPPMQPAPTPMPTPQSEKILKRVGEQEGSFLIQKINHDSVDGLWYMAYPIAREQGEPRTLHLGEDIGYACEGITEKLTNIDFSGQTVTFEKVTGQSPIGGCPICLASTTQIDTPSGQIPVKDLHVGMSVWTVNKTGHRVSGIILKMSKVPVPPTHRMVHLILHDERELLVSPGHPTVDARTVQDLSSGDRYDNAFIVSTEHIPYLDGATYDILPSGDTGFYFANDILIDSTLH